MPMSKHKSARCHCLPECPVAITSSPCLPSCIRYPSEAPKGKGNRVAESSGIVASANVQLPDIALKSVTASSFSYSSSRRAGTACYCASGKLGQCHTLTFLIFHAVCLDSLSLVPCPCRYKEQYKLRQLQQSPKPQLQTQRSSRSMATLTDVMKAAWAQGTMFGGGGDLGTGVKGLSSTDRSRPASGSDKPAANGTDVVAAGTKTSSVV
jgi:hypothetical protein